MSNHANDATQHHAEGSTEKHPLSHAVLGTAFDKTLLVAQFDAAGQLLHANSNFVAWLGGPLEAWLGKSHRSLCEPKYSESNAYQTFWEQLRYGKTQQGQYLHLGHEARQLWLQASYVPVLNERHELTHVLLVGSDITADKIAALDIHGKIKAISKAQAMVEFNPEGNILWANEKFLKTVNYTLEEIQGRHHRIFMDPKEVETLEYRKFWDKLRRGEFDSGEYRRYGQDAQEIWLQASYNPVFDIYGKVFKVIKIATDITKQKAKALDAQGKLDALGKSQSIAEFSPEGNILWANEKLLSILGYDNLSELQGKNHRMFCAPAFAESAAYRDFWEQVLLGKAISGEYKRFGKHGREVWLHVSFSPILNDDHKVFRVLMFASDITAEKRNTVDSAGKINAISKSQGIIEFSLDGKILAANDNFCKLTGYSEAELKGQHHRIFCTHQYRESIEYRQFWEKLNQGHFDAGEYKRLAKDGREVWIQATYNPIVDSDGKVYKVVKFAADVTQAKMQAIELHGKINAINKSLATVEFKMDGTVTYANENFLNVLGYTLDEIKGKHHRMFCDPKYTETFEYRRFWERLNQGEYDAGEYKRIGRGGKEVWIQATYNPIKDADGKPFKVIKFATDITEQKVKNALFEGKVNAVSKLRQVITEYAPDGRLLSANDNFLALYGYAWEEVKNRHHRELCEPSFANSTDYRLFWEKMARGESENNETKHLGKNGKEIWLQSSYNPILNNEGKVVMIMSIATDITAQHKKVYEFDKQVAQLEETANGLSAAAHELTKTAATMTSSAQKTSQESVAASQSLTEVASGVQTVASNTEQMVASIREISHSANESAGMSKVTSATTQETNDVVKELGASSLEIGEVTKVISSIAQQTNLLALNATIEAARAGDAGKGFAVVANEVKELARQTAKATEDITQKIGAIQKKSSRAVEAIGGIAQAVGKLNGISGTIAAAVEEQTATTNEVSRVITVASGNVRRISSSVQLVSTAADENSVAAAQTLEASRNLSQLAEKLKSIVERVKSA